MNYTSHHHRSGTGSFSTIPSEKKMTNLTDGLALVRVHNPCLIVCLMIFSYIYIALVCTGAPMVEDITPGLKELTGALVLENVKPDAVGTRAGVSNREDDSPIPNAVEGNLWRKGSESLKDSRSSSSAQRVKPDTIPSPENDPSTPALISLLTPEERRAVDNHRGRIEGWVVITIPEGARSEDGVTFHRRELKKRPEGAREKTKVMASQSRAVEAIDAGKDNRFLPESKTETIRRVMDEPIAEKGFTEPVTGLFIEPGTFLDRPRTFKSELHKIQGTPQSHQPKSNLNSTPVEKSSLEQKQQKPDPERLQTKDNNAETKTRIKKYKSWFLKRWKTFRGRLRSN